MSAYDLRDLLYDISTATDVQSFEAIFDKIPECLYDRFLKFAQENYGTLGTRHFRLVFTLFAKMVIVEAAVEYNGQNFQECINNVPLIPMEIKELVISKYEHALHEHEFDESKSDNFNVMLFYHDAAKRIVAWLSKI